MRSGCAAPRLAPADMVTSDGSAAALPVPSNRLRVRVEGVVQGVGFRPFVHGLATAGGLSGLVGNDTAGVFIEIEGTPGELDRFLAALEGEAPPLAVIDRVETEVISATGGLVSRLSRASRPGSVRP